MTSDREKSHDVDLGPPHACAHTCMHISTYPVSIACMYATTTSCTLKEKKKKKKSFSLGVEEPEFYLHSNSGFRVRVVVA